MCVWTLETASEYMPHILLSLRISALYVDQSSPFQMDEPNWKEEVLRSLEQRDARELRSAELYEFCSASESDADLDLKLAISYATVREECSSRGPALSPGGQRYIALSFLKSVVMRPLL